MLRYFITTFYAASLSIMVSSVTHAQSDEAKDYLKAAEPYLTLSCQALVDTYGDDEKQMEEIITLMTAVSVINRQIDITKLLPDEADKKEFSEFMEKALMAQCEDDVDSLIAGNVDRAVAYAFTDQGEAPKE